LGCIISIITCYTFGFVYWALDYKPSPNWLNATPPQDWINKLLNEQGKTKGAPYNPAQPNENCNADLGLPSPELNAVKLNDYYSQQNPAPTDPSFRQITGSSGESTIIDRGENVDTGIDPNVDISLNTDRGRTRTAVDESLREDTGSFEDTDPSGWGASDDGSSSEDPFGQAETANPFGSFGAITGSFG
jgi:hypothetical protein